MESSHLKLISSSINSKNVQPDSLIEDEEIILAANVTDAGALVGSDDCGVCGYSPCACGYMLKISPDGSMSELGALALEQMDKPFPHRAACPCPSCYSDRLRTWDGAVSCR